MRHRALVLSLTLTCLFSHAQQKISIVKIQLLSKTFANRDDGEIRILKIDCYLVKGYRNNKISDAYLDRFVEKHKDPSLIKYWDYYMFFYKESNTTHLKIIQDAFRLTGTFNNEDDFIYAYNWQGFGKHFEKQKLDTGKVDYTKSKVVIKNIHIPADTIKKD
jgi:hypothetical protein